MTPQSPRDIAAIILAAGEGRRLRPLTELLPKPLCPVGNVALLDRALERVAGLGFRAPDSVAVNACYLADQVVTHVGDRAWLSREPGSPLGTAGGVGFLRQWIGGRGALVGNADAYLTSTAASPGDDLAALLDGWDGQTVRILGVPALNGAPPEFCQHRFAGFSLLPWADIARLPAGPGNLVSTTWRPAEREGRLEVIEYAGTYLDTGTPVDYLAANLHTCTTGQGSQVAEGAEVSAPLMDAVIGGGALVHGPVTRGVVWPGGYVGQDEHLVDAIRVGRDLTVSGVPSTVGRAG
ncbi:MAG: NTP transferase domain-containing protein [Micromonosporaceae bacterium]|nr:NTP transferase domain-containing protein [Micromonosporaceae bacterium]